MKSFFLLRRVFLLFLQRSAHFRMRVFKMMNALKMILLLRMRVLLLRRVLLKMILLRMRILLLRRVLRMRVLLMRRVILRMILLRIILLRRFLLNKEKNNLILTVQTNNCNNIHSESHILSLHLGSSFSPFLLISNESFGNFDLYFFIK